MFKYLEKIFKIVTDILLFIIIIAIFFTIYAYYQKDILKRDYISYFGYTFFEVASGSMSDTINIKDLVIIKIGNDSLKVDDIVTYKSNEDFITHRIISINDNSIITKGDANNDSDRPVDRNDVLGKVVFVIPSFGVYRLVLFDIRVIISVLVTLILFVIYFSIRKKSDFSLKQQAYYINLIAYLIRIYEKVEKENDKKIEK